eukprot:Platyproteum_vivax@DN5056_c0_g1_i1.p1
MCVPFILLVVLAAYGGTLPGATAGIHAYVGGFDIRKMFNTPEIWPAATAQVFFSTSVCWGILTAYGSHNKQTQNVKLDSMVIVWADFLTSFVAGFAVFCVIGFTAQQLNVSMDDLSLSGPLLVFVTYPVGLAQLPVPQLWCVLFFLTLILLGIDSAFSMVESIVTPLADSTWFHKTPRWKIVLALSILGLSLSTFYCLDIGLTLLDNVDWFISHIVLMTGAIVKTAIVGWTFNAEVCVQKLGSPWPLLLWGASYAAGISIGVGCGLGIPAVGAIIGPCVCVGVIIAGAGASYLWAKAINKELSHKERLWWLFLGSIELFRKEVNDMLTEKKEVKGWRAELLLVSHSWSVLIKYLIPAAGLILWAVDLRSLTRVFHINIAYKVIGLIWVLFAYLTVILSVALPNLKIFTGFLLDPLAKEHKHRESELEIEIPVNSGSIASPLERLTHTRPARSADKIGSLVGGEVSRRSVFSQPE